MRRKFGEFLETAKWCYCNTFYLDKTYCELIIEKAFFACPLGLRRAGFRRARGVAHSHPPADPSDTCEKRRQKARENGVWKMEERGV